MIHDDWIKVVNSELKRREWSRTRLADEIGGSRALITNILNGHQAAGRQMIERIAEVLELEVSISLKRKKRETAKSA